MVDEGELKTLVNPESIVEKWSDPSENPSDPLKSLVPEVGIEPTRGLSPAGF